MQKYELSNLPAMEISITSNQMKLTPEQLDTLKKEAEEIVKLTNQIAVMEMDDVALANTVMKTLAKKVKTLEGLRKVITSQIDAKKAEVTNQFGLFIDPLAEEVDRLKADLLSFEKRQREEEEKARQARLAEERARREEEEKARQLRAEEQRQKALLNGVTDIEFVEVEEVEAVEIEEVQPQRTTSITGISSTRYKKWEITDFDKIPREYLVVDTVKMNNVRKTFDYKDESPIPGIKFTVETGIRG